jgi:hypothetical protein
MHEIFFLSCILLASCYFTCTCLVLEISLFGLIAVNIVKKVFHIWHSDPYMDRLRPSRESKKGVMAERKQFSNTKSIVKVETGIVTLISHHHSLKIVGNNKLWPHMQKESWNIHGTKMLIFSITLNGTESSPSLAHKRTEGYVIIYRVQYVT